MKKLFLLVLFTCMLALLKAQQHSIYSQYLFNLFVVNPAYAGEIDGLATSLSYRTQWVGFEGAPKTQNFSAHTSLPRENMALGIQLQNDAIGGRQTSTASLAYAYKLKLYGAKHLSFGLQGGMMNYQYRWDELTYRQRTDPVAYGTDGNKWVPNFDFGVMYLDLSSYIGLSATSLNNSRIINSTSSDARLNTFLNFIAGKIFPVSDKISLKPSAIVRKSMQGPLQFDLNAGVFYDNKIWITTSYRYDYGMVFSGHFYVNDMLHIGYSYDLALNNLLSEQGGTHELFIGYNFNLFNSKKIGLRQF